MTHLSKIGQWGLAGALSFGIPIGLDMLGYPTAAGVWFGASLVIPMLIGWARSRDLIGREYPGSDRVVVGVVNQVLAPEDFDRYMIPADLREIDEDERLAHVHRGDPEPWRQWLANVPLFGIFAFLDGERLVVDAGEVEVGDHVNLDVEPVTVTEEINAYRVEDVRGGDPA